MASVATDGETAKFVPPDAPYNGAFTKSLPIAVPAFFGLTPALSLDYNSGDSRLRADDGFSPLGVGWTLSGGSEISRVSKHGGTPAYSADDVFAIDGNALLSCAAARTTPSCGAGGTHTTRFETYQRIIQAVVSGQTVWTVTRRDGTVSTYRPLANWNPGGAQDARLRDSYRWLLADVRDTDGNTVSYSYDCATLPACYVSAIDYGVAKVSFYWESRPDSVSFATGISVAAVSKRLKTVAVSSSDVLVRAYSVSYAISPDTKRSLLTSVQQFGSDATIVAGVVTGGTSLPPETFSYWDMSSRRMGAMISDLVTANTNSETVPSTTATEPQSKLATVGATPQTDIRYVFGDFNGDRKTDLLQGWLQTIDKCRSTGYYASGLWAGSSTTPTGGPGLSDPSALAPINLCGGAMGWTTGDFNGDGKDDLVTVAQLSKLTTAARTPWTAQGYKTTDAAIVVVLQSNGVVVGSIVTPIGAVNSGANAGLRNATQSAKLLVGDFNGDGKDDIFRGSMFLSSGGGLSKQTWVNADWGRVGDFNGDGLADLFVLDGANGTNSRLLLSNGSGFDVKPLGQTLTTRGAYYWPEYEPPLTTAVGSRIPATGYYFDGYNAVYSQYRRSFDSTSYSYRWAGVGYGRNPTDGGYLFEIGATRSDQSNNCGDSGGCDHDRSHEIARITLESSPVRLGEWGFADLNGDGSTDALQVIETSGVRSLVKYLSTGVGFQRTVEVANLAGTALGNEFAFSLADVNGDGVVELIRPNAAKTAYSIHKVADGYPATYAISGVTSLDGFAGDYNGDGKRDLKQAISAAPANCSGCVAAASDSVVPDLMKRNTLSTGGVIDLEYLPSTYGTNGYLPMVLQVVSKITTSDGRGNSSATKFAYLNGAYDPFERKFLGFETVTAELPCEVGETSCPWAVSRFRQEAVAAGAPRRVETYASNGSQLRLVESGYVVNQSSPPFSVHKTSEQITNHLLGGSVITRKEWTYDGYANVLEENDLGVLSSSADDRVTQRSYPLNLAAYLVKFPSTETIKDGAGVVLQDTQLHYDGANSAASAPAEGHVTTSLAWLNEGNRWLATTAEYDSFGRPIARVNPLGDRVEVDYDPATHQHVIEIRNPLFFDGDVRQRTTTSWHPICGLQSAHIDVNNRSTNYQYDALCRLIRVDYPSGDHENISYVSVGSAATQYVERSKSPSDEVTPLWGRTYADGLGRTYKTVSVSADPAKPIVTDTSYSKRGVVAGTTAPHYHGQQGNWNLSRFDALDRPVHTTLPDGTAIAVAYEAPTTIAAGALTVRTTDPLSRTGRTTTDARGNEVTRTAYLGAAAATTRFGYDPLGNRVLVTDPMGNLWSNTYDSLGRRTSSTDPDLGTWKYVYDDAGRQITQLDAKSQLTSFSYDRLGRVITKTIGVGMPSEEVVTSIYDEARSGFYNVGHLTTSSNDNAVIYSDYDAGGRPVRETHTVDGVAYTTTTVYDAGGRIRAKTYPEGSSSSAYGYNAAGQLVSVEGAISGITYAAYGAVTAITYSNGVSTTYAYSPTRSWLDSISTRKGDDVIQSYSYTRDVVGRIIGVDSDRGDEDWAYGYDQLDRLLSAANTGSPTLSQSFEYDLGGAILFNSSVGGYSYPASGSAAFQPHAVSSAGVWSFEHDLNGNQTSRRTAGVIDRTIQYDAANRPIAVMENGATVVYSYGPDGERLKKLTAVGTTLYIGADSENDPVGGWTNYLNPDVKEAGGVVNWLHRDHLTSVRRITDATGALTRASFYQPYGAQFETVIAPLSPNESKGWIGERTDPESGLVYLHARYFDPVLGRFLSPDWWDPASPTVGTDRYGYSMGDPINRSDPNGHESPMCTPGPFGCSSLGLGLGVDLVMDTINYAPNAVGNVIIGAGGFIEPYQVHIDALTMAMEAPGLKYATVGVSVSGRFLSQLSALQAARRGLATAGQVTILANAANAFHHMESNIAMLGRWKPNPSSYHEVAEVNKYAYFSMDTAEYGKYSKFPSKTSDSLAQEMNDLFIATVIADRKVVHFTDDPLLAPRGSGLYKEWKALEKAGYSPPVKKGDVWVSNPPTGGGTCSLVSTSRYC